MALESILAGIQGTLSNIAPTLSVILIILSGIVYAFAQMQPAEARGKYTTAAISIFVGGVIIAAISAAAPAIASTSQGVLQ
jgi:type IV secretory pathway VirB2 component (pilin)